ncbi:MAG TPA: cbb3-type cytochrome c oxidase subunit I [Acidobacteriaceae bacterium]|jgi:cytochrome c oxidase subunit 1|nr:cbb3-type cytochrome c oxidase subunit I [Acidobacteriaceae bacterium]
MDESLKKRSRFRRCVLTTDHRVIGMQYLWLGLAAVTCGTLLSLLMRIHLVWPNTAMPGYGMLKPEDYLALVTIHGTLMIFFVLTAAPQNGLASLVLPGQIGARRMVFPVLNALSFWIVLGSLLVLLATFAVTGGAPISGWTSYPPLSAIAGAGPGQAMGMDLWLVSIALFCFGSILSAISVIATVLLRRAPGMTWMRMPLTVWSWFVGACMIVPAFSVLLAAATMLFSDRHMGTSFFLPAVDVVSGHILHRAGGSPLLWLHLFWFFGHPEVYIAVLPAMGLTSALLANFSRRPPISYRAMVYATIAIGVLGFMVWGHHMFVSGMNPYASRSFSLTTIAIAVPSTIEVILWLGTLMGGGLRRTTPLLFTLGFLSMFITGGATGPILAQPVLDSYLHNTYFVVAHFHLVMGMAGVFALFAAVYYWFPLMTGRMMNEALGKWHFWLTLVGAYAVFFPMHWAGLAGEPRHYAQLTGTAAYLAQLVPLQKFISLAAFALGAAQLLFVWNLLHSMRHGRIAARNPWQATTLEWSEAYAEDAPENAQTVMVGGPYEYSLPHDQAGTAIPCETIVERE